MWKRKAWGELFYFPHQQEYFSCVKWKSNFPDTKAKTDATCPSASREHLPTCTPAASVGSIRVTSTPPSTIFNFLKRYLYISLSLPTVTLVHSSLTMYQENILCEKAGLDVIICFCSYHEKKSAGLCSSHSSLHNVWTFLFEAEDRWFW